MSRFAPALRRVARELGLPRRRRTPLLLEMAADLEAVYEHHRGRGVPDREAARLAEEMVLGSSEVIRRLARLHDTPWRGWAVEIGARLQSGLDLVLLMTAVLPAMALAGAVSVWALAADPTPAAWAIAVVGVFMVAALATGTTPLLRRRPPVGGVSPAVLVLAALSCALGLLAPVLGIREIGFALAGAEPMSSMAVAAVVARDGATLIAGLLLALGGLLGWFVLLYRETQRAVREVDALLEGTAPDRPFHPSVDGPDDTEGIIPLQRRRHV